MIRCMILSLALLLVLSCAQFMSVEETESVRIVIDDEDIWCSGIGGPTPSKMLEIEDIDCIYGNPDCDQVDHKADHSCLAIHNSCWKLEVTNKAPEKAQVIKGRRLWWGTIHPPMDDFGIESKYNMEFIDRVFEGDTFAYPIWTKKDTCKHGSYISMGDGIGTCLKCGKAVIYDKKRWERLLEIMQPKKLEKQ